MASLTHDDGADRPQPSPEQHADMSLPTLQIIVGSTRPGRIGLPIADWFRQHAEAHGGFAVELIDLAEVNLPLFDEPQHPRLGRYTHQHTKDWSATISRGDAYVFVIPEYNHGINAATKNAIDYLHHEWHHKPVGFISYGGASAGTRAANMLKQIVTALRMVPVTDAVNIPFVQQFLDPDQGFVPNEATRTAATDMLNELARMTAALRPLRAGSSS
jgi:NAD(P)H-dependent FMN reductase